MVNTTLEKFGYPDTLIKEYDHWIVLLRKEQVTIGSLVLCAKSDVTEFSALSPEAFTEMNVAISDIERTLKQAFDYDKINYLMLMMVDPHVHFHVFPRYADKRDACNLSMIDAGWPAAPKLVDAKVLSSQEMDELRHHILRFW
ncbi:HIT family protein [Marinomonas sp. C2222]|uniref:HIT family protein n=1 Tax=Marinomonas sargassi TaxID=2984494 RepID=A0ABT2YQR5_9GAMM|nr:HIT family protein [Marinomonas sargassi]MCV2402228.1 HIT family protein [Marinomonas sargassi]